MTLDLGVMFFVEGEAKPAGSKVSGVAHRKGENGQYEPVRGENGKLKTFTKDSSGEKGKAWRGDVRDAARRAMDGQPPYEGPLALSVTFFRARPKGHYGSGRNAAVLKSGAPAYPTSRPDATKLVRAVEDALLGLAYADDSQVVVLFAQKAWAEDGRVGAEVVLTRIQAPSLRHYLGASSDDARPQLSLA